MFKVGDKVRLSAKFDPYRYELETAWLFPFPNRGVIEAIEPEADPDTSRNHVRLETPGLETISEQYGNLGSFNDDEIEHDN